MKEPPQWNEDPQCWLEYKSALRRWCATGTCPEDLQPHRVAYHFKAMGLCNRLFESMDQDRLNWKKSDGNYWPKDADGTYPVEAYDVTPQHYRAVPGVHGTDLDVDQHSQATIASYDDPMGASIKKKYTTGMEYFIEFFSEEFEKSDRHTFSVRFGKLFNIRRRDRHVADWLADFDRARMDLQNDPIGKDLFKLPDFIWANWIVETAELTSIQRRFLETRLPAWREVTEAQIREGIRDLIQPAEYQPRAGRTRVNYTTPHLTDPSNVNYVHSAVHGWDVEYDYSTGVYCNSQSPDDAAYYVYWAEQHHGAPYALWGTTDSGENWFAAEETDPGDEGYDYQKAAPDLSKYEACSAVWGVNEHDGGFECLAVYPIRGGGKGAGGRHEKEGDGHGKPNKDGLTCHGCGGNDHFSNNCPTKPRQTTAGKGRKGKGGGKGFRPPPRGKSKGKSIDEISIGKTPSRLRTHDSNKASRNIVAQ